jgi:serine/threonine-protein kinase RsbT
VNVVGRHEIPITREDDIIVVRRRVRELVEQRKFDTFATAAITTATSELARNIVVHAGKGVAIIEEVAEGPRVGLRVTFRDEGPGIEDIPRVLAGGHSTARTMGLGLSGSKRLVDDFAIESRVGSGTCITILKWKRF